MAGPREGDLQSERRRETDRAITFLSRKTLENKAMSSKKPIHEIRLGRIKSAIWENEGENGAVRYGVTLARLFRTDKGTWRDSASFGRDDLPLVEKVCHMTHLWIFSHSQGGVVQTADAPHTSEPDDF